MTRETHLYREFKHIAVLGTGTMGAQIAAHLTNCGLDVILFGLTEAEDPNATAQKAIKNLKSLKPPALALPNWGERIRPASYRDNLPLLKDRHLVIEAVSENLDIKKSVYGKVIPHLNSNAILASNTSALSITRMSEWMPASLRQRFFGIHFFNPPRYMPLTELIMHENADPETAAQLERFLTSVAGKQTVRAKDSPGFIANRLGVFGMAAALFHARRLGIGFDTADALCGTRINRAKSACFRTADLVGLDIIIAVMNNLTEVLKQDPWQQHFAPPEWITKMVAAGSLGQKTGKGIYKKVGKDILVFDTEANDYRPADKKISKECRRLLGDGIAAALPKLRESKDPHCQFLWAVHRDQFHYALTHLPELAETVRDADLAMRHGFGWKDGIFSLWQSAGGKSLTALIEEDIKEGRTMSDATLPPAPPDGFYNNKYNNKGAWSPAAKKYLPTKNQPTDLAPLMMSAEKIPQLKVVEETEWLRATDLGDEILAINFKTKMHTISYELLKDLETVWAKATAEYGALILWQEEAPFCAGANLYQILASAKLGAYEQSGMLTDIKMRAFEALNPKLPKLGKLPPIREVIQRLQNICMSFKHGDIPVVAAVDGLALGGGCELLLHCDRVVATTNSFIGLVEIGVGVLPAGGGSKEMARRAEECAGETPLFPFLAKFYEQIALAKVAAGADDARRMGYLRAADKVIANPQELLYVARNSALELMRGNYRPPYRRNDIKITGRPGKGNFLAQLTNLRAGNFISEHDYFCAAEIANVLCGGETDADQTASDEWFLQLEREGFLRLLKTNLSQKRIEHILKTGKPLRN